MSYLGITLQRIAGDNDRSQKLIAENSGISRSTINRIFSGEIKDVADADFAAIASATTQKKQQQAELVAARCDDVRNGPGADLVEIVVRGKPVERKLTEFPEVKLSREHERALAFLRSQVPLNEALGDVLKNMAVAMGLK